MAGTIPLNAACEQIEKALGEYARNKGWAKEDYELVVHRSMWDSAHVTLAAREFRDEEGFAARDKEILQYLEEKLGRQLRNRVGMLRTMSLERFRRLGLSEHLSEIVDHLGLTTDEEFFAEGPE